MSKTETLIHLTPIEEIMSDSFARYAKYIIQDRALPDIRDGLKPVQRRIVYAMNDLQLFFDQQHKKSARVVGEVIGKYHPHGDSSIYDAMIRMSQSWKNNIPLIDIQGNNGSIDNDPAAAMRYTEARLSRYGQLLIQNIKKDTVKFISNFDESEVEPTILPTLLPNLLINGSSGIAAGYATNIPPFNPTEVIDAVITRMDSPNCFLSSILKVMPGPDFPTGAFILNPEEIKKAYETGKGKLTLRANIIRKTQKLIHITEIPFETCKSSIIKSIRELSIKYESLRISEVNDESDRNGLCISIETRPDSNFDFIKNFLLKNTQLQITYSINMIAIQNRKPCLLPMLNLLDSFIEHIDNITTSVAKFDLKKAQSRQDIVKGLIKAIKILDDVVNLIRHSTDKASAKDQLIKKLMFNENQAEAIVTLRLYRLSNNDVSELNKELLALDEEISILLLILNNKEYRNSFIKNKLREYKKIFTSPRKSKILNEDSKIEIDLNDTIEDRDTIVVVTKDGYIKNIPRKSYFATEYNELKLKDGDIPVAQFNSNLRDKVVLITSDGNYISIPNHKIEMSKWKELGIHVNNIITNETEFKVINAFNFSSVTDNRCLIIASKNSMIKRTNINTLGISKLSKISTIMSLQPNDEIVSCIISSSIDNVNEKVCTITRNGMSLLYPTSQISIVSKNAAGVNNINLKNDDIVVSTFLLDELKDYVSVISTQGFKRINRTMLPLSNRSRSGSWIISQVKNNPITLINAFSNSSTDLINIVDESNVWHLLKSSEIPFGDVNSRVSSFKGKKIKLSSYLQPLDAENNIDQGQLKLFA